MVGREAQHRRAVREQPQRVPEAGAAREALLAGGQPLDEQVEQQPVLGREPGVQHPGRARQRGRAASTALRGRHVVGVAEAPVVAERHDHVGREPFQDRADQRDQRRRTAGRPGGRRRGRGTRRGRCRARPPRRASSATRVAPSVRRVAAAESRICPASPRVRDTTAVSAPGRGGPGDGAADAEDLVVGVGEEAEHAQRPAAAAAVRPERVPRSSGKGSAADMSRTR